MKKSLMILCVLAMCSVVWAEDKKAEEVKKEKPDYRSVIVDAWLVRVDADALAESGVKPLSEKEKENVSVMNLLWCLNEPNSGEVITSARTQSFTNENSQSRLQKTQYIKRDTSPNSYQFSPYSSKVEFKTENYLLDNKKVRIEYSFITSYISISDSNSPPDDIDIFFANILTMPIQKSVIVGQSQIENDMFFLVMKAEIVE
ncbi:MAG: hypothetical protein A2Y12_03840 [Planctomycetes bacterium GWF2_42_9]|nr:MAG: hypothetical protein A2Y12_03840 [Planctomycetes bacterium GWF2_42_9]